MRAGFPIEDTQEFGPLHITFKVGFPQLNELTAQNFEMLGKALPPVRPLEVPPGSKVENCFLAEFEQSRRYSQQSDDENEQGHPVQCATH